MQGHGYKEIMRALVGEYPLEEGIRLLKRNTRRYVKYQLMSLRGMGDEVHYVRADQPHDTVVEQILKAFRNAGQPTPLEEPATSPNTQHPTPNARRVGE